MKKEFDLSSLDAHVFSEQRQCPVCGSDRRGDCDIPFRSNRYVQAGAQYLGLDEQLLFDRMKGRRCAGCGTVYFDPWLSPRFARELYHRILPHHNLGWWEFYNFVRAPEAVLQRADLVARLRAAVPALKMYGEVGCPFEGLLPFFAVQPYRSDGEEFLDYPGGFPFDRTVGGNPDVRGNSINFERIGRTCSDVFNRLQLLRVFPPARIKQQYLHWRGLTRPVTTQSITTVYLEKESSALWGSECQSLGVQCRQVAENVLACGAARLGELPREQSFDLIGVFNALDHYTRPVELLQELLTISKFVYIEGHGSADAGKQHPFLLSEQVFSNLRLHGTTSLSRFNGTEDPEVFSVLLRKDL